MRSRLPIIIGLLVLWSAAGMAATTYYIPETAERKLRNLERSYPRWFHLETIGETARGRPLLLGVLTDHSTGPFDQKPAMMLQGGFDGRDPLGPHLVNKLAHDWTARASGDADLAATLAAATIYLYFDGNPDGRAALAAGITSRGNLTPHDDDRDQISDEDGFRDINGDGLITAMRRADPAGAHRASKLDPRVVVPRDRELGPRYRLWDFEGIDHDRDGLVGEDPPGGVYGGANFGIHWDDVPKDREGLYPFSEPETRALIDFMLAHRNTALAIEFRPNNGRLDIPPAHSASDKLDPADTVLFSVIAHILESKATPAHKATAQQGSPLDWFYFNWGIPASQLGLCPAPKLPDSVKKIADSVAATDYERDQYAWWRLADDHPEWHAALPWQPFDHPDLGEVEIGGFAYPYPLAPPLLAVDSVIAPWPDRLLSLTRLLPHAELTGLQSELVTPGVYRVTATVANRGPFPAATAQQIAARFGSPNTIDITIPDGAEILAGRPHVVLGALNPEAPAETVEWLVRAAAASTFTVTVTTDRAGVVSQQRGFTP